MMKILQSEENTSEASMNSTAAVNESSFNVFLPVSRKGKLEEDEENGRLQFCQFAAITAARDLYRRPPGLHISNITIPLSDHTGRQIGNYVFSRHIFKFYTTIK